MKTREVEIRFSGERIIHADVLADGSCKLVVQLLENNENEVIIEQSETQVDDDMFILVEASKLSLDDEFLKYKPITEREKDFKELLTKVIQKGISDFYRPKYDPSFDEEGTGISFKAGEKPAVGKSYNWWNEVAKKFMPKRHSRLGTKSEYVAFLGVLIKMLVADGFRVAKAWDVVCNNSKRLGHYSNSIGAKDDLEKTGMRRICVFHDLANTCKMIAEDDDECLDSFWLAGGNYILTSLDYPLARLGRCVDYDDWAIWNDCDADDFGSVGWIVLEK